jgi:CRISPR-associated endonuclease/helicase Cas3
MATSAAAPEFLGTFQSQFTALTGYPPYPWQEKLFELFIRGTFPPDINLPTGSGKTSLIPIWLLALAHQASAKSEAITIPRRLVWVVNRRVVVDQATDEAEEIRKRLADTAGLPALNSVRKALRDISLNQDGTETIAISTLRGEKEDNREWSDDPSRPAIIVGTVDMIGSRLLFSGYGDGPYWRAHHAGLLGQDTLIVNDEAHLTRPFADLLTAIEKKQPTKIKPFHTIRLSATHSSSKC